MHSPYSRDIIWFKRFTFRNFVHNFSIFQLLLGIDGSHLNLPGVEYIPVEALRIEPLCPKGFMTVDGEVVPWGPLQCEVLARKGRIMTR